MTTLAQRPKEMGNPLTWAFVPFPQFWIPIDPLLLPPNGLTDDRFPGRPVDGPSSWRRDCRIMPQLPGFPPVKTTAHALQNTLHIYVFRYTTQNFCIVSAALGQSHHWPVVSFQSSEWMRRLVDFQVLVVSRVRACLASVSGMRQLALGV